MEHEGRAGGDGTLDPWQVEERFYCGEILPEEMPGIALQALVAGFDGPALLALARLGEPTPSDVADLFERALAEIGRRSPFSREDGLRMARGIARRMVSGKVHPYEGARLIWTKVWNACGRPDELTPFVGLASLYEADPERRPFHLEQILARAEELVREQEER